MDMCKDSPLPKDVALRNGQSVSLPEADRFADELQRLSDAALLEDSFTSLAIPSLSGPVEGFGSQALEPTFDTDQAVEKLSKAKNKKP